MVVKYISPLLQEMRLRESEGKFPAGQPYRSKTAQVKSLAGLW